jgi:hypothetical protein
MLTTIIFCLKLGEEIEPKIPGFGHVVMPLQKSSSY